MFPKIRFSHGSQTEFSEVSSWQDKDRWLSCVFNVRLYSHTRMTVYLQEESDVAISVEPKRTRVGVPPINCRMSKVCGVVDYQPFHYCVRRYAYSGGRITVRIESATESLEFEFRLRSWKGRYSLCTAIPEFNRAHAKRRISRAPNCSPVIDYSLFIYKDDPELQLAPYLRAD